MDEATAKNIAMSLERIAVALERLAPLGDAVEGVHGMLGIPVEIFQRDAENPIRVRVAEGDVEARG